MCGLFLLLFYSVGDDIQDHPDYITIPLNTHSHINHKWLELVKLIILRFIASVPPPPILHFKHVTKELCPSHKLGINIMTWFGYVFVGVCSGENRTGLKKMHCNKILRLASKKVMISNGQQLGHKISFFRFSFTSQ